MSGRPSVAHYLCRQRGTNIFINLQPLAIGGYMKINKLDFYFFGDTGEYDCYNPLKVNRKREW